MNPVALTVAALRGDDLSVRQHVKDAAREGFCWASAPDPGFPVKRARARAVYASMVELLAWRAGQDAPAWTSAVQGAPQPVFLVRSAKKSKALLRESLENTPAPLKKRNVFALPDYLDLLPA
jgi:hypothetical protein